MTGNANPLIGFWTPPWSVTAGVVFACGPDCFGVLEAQGWHPATIAEKDRLLADSRRYGRRVDETEMPQEPVRTRNGVARALHRLWPRRTR